MDIERLQHPVPQDEFYRRYAERRPLIVHTESLAQLGWRTHLWDDAYLEHKAGAHNVLVLKRSRSADYAPERSSYVPMRFREFVRTVLANPAGSADYYLNLQTDKVLEPPLLQLLGDFGIPEYFKDLPLRSINVWMGNSPTDITTPLHHDFNDNLYVVVQGRKRFAVFPPSEAPHLYTRGRLQAVEPNGLIRYANGMVMPHLSQVDILHPDRARFPAYTEAEKLRVDFTVNSGEMLFLPAGWFHQVNSGGRHIAVSFFAELPQAEGLARMRKDLQSRQAAARAGG
ncbi:MAG: cupin-like domain-containing protein [Gammaproteobacteria bacterium]|nr:cupin-like domain-containing protein [Gammaproteobacteria bacterium]